MVYSTARPYTKFLTVPRLAAQGKTAMGAGRRNIQRRSLAALALPAPCPREDRLRPACRALQRRPRYRRKAPGAHPGTMGFNLQQRTPGGLERHLQNRQSQGARIPKRPDLHHYDLPDRSPARAALQIHLKRRGALF